jgi:hypothetical protein
LLAALMSTQIHVPPSFFGVHTIGQIHGVGWSQTLSIISSTTNFFNAFDTSLRI